MEGSRFDAWTRRRVGLAASGLAGALLTVSGIESVRAKKKKKKCEKVGDPCTPGGNKKCCKCLECGPDEEGFSCCQLHGEPCTPAAADKCCSKTCTGGFCVCKTNGQGCTLDNQCCSFNCAASGMGSTCQP